MSTLSSERRENIDRCVGDEQRLGIGRHVHDEDMADPARGADAGVLVDDFGHQLVGVETAFHQRVGLAIANELDGLRRRSMTVWRRYELQARDVQIERGGEIADARLGSDQNRLDDLGFCRLDGAAQRGFVAGMRDRGADRRQRVAGVDQRLILLVLARFGHGGHGNRTFLR